MEEEFVKYRKASIKQKLSIAKKFSKFYFNQYTPMTKLEMNDLDSSRRFYRGVTVMITIGVGSLSMVYRMARVGGIKHEMMSRDYNMFGNIMQDGAWAFIGFVMSQWYTSTYVYQ